MGIVETLQGFREGTVPEDTFLRAVLRHPSWHVPVDDQNHPALWALGAQEFVAAQVAPRSPDGGDARWLEVDGRHLVRNLPADCAGVVFELATPAACVVERDASAEALAHWMSVLDAEDALAAPRPGQLGALLAHQWYVLCNADGDALADELGPYRVAHVFSATDRLRAFAERRPAYRQTQLVRVAGVALFAALSTRSDLDGVALHWGHEQTELLGPHAAGLMIQGVDGRSSARVLPARTIAEIHLFLDLEGCVRETRAHQLEYLGETLVARYSGTVAGGRRTWWFDVVEPTDDPLDLGVGASEILCAGQLADLVRRRLRALPDDPARVDGEGRLEAAGAARWAHELEKMLHEGALPRAAVRTPDGSRYLRELPELATAGWIHDARRRAEALAGTA